MSREFVDSVISDNNVEAEKSFKDGMATKVGDALEIRRKEVSRTFVNTPTEVESE